MRYKTLLKRGFSKSEARKLATPRKLTKDNCNNFDGAKVLKRFGLTKEKIKEALKMKIRGQVERRGVISPVKTPCKCGGMGMLQEWIESDFRGDSKRYAVVFCQECNERTNVYSERTQRESRQEALNEWNLRNLKKV